MARAASPPMLMISQAPELPVLGRKRSKSNPEREETVSEMIERRVRENKEKAKIEQVVREAKRNEERTRHEERLTATRAFLEESRCNMERSLASIDKVGCALESRVEDKFEAFKKDFDMAMSNVVGGM